MIDFYFRSRLFVCRDMLTLSTRLLAASEDEPNQQHLELPSGLLSKHYPCQMWPQNNVEKGADVSNTACTLSLEQCT